MSSKIFPLVVLATVLLCGNGCKQKKEAPNMIEEVMDNSIVKSAMRTAATTLTRTLLGALGLGGRSKKKSSWL